MAKKEEEKKQAPIKSPESNQNKGIKKKGEENPKKLESSKNTDKLSEEKSENPNNSSNLMDTLKNAKSGKEKFAIIALHTKIKLKLLWNLFLGNTDKQKYGQQYGVPTRKNAPLIILFLVMNFLLINFIRSESSNGIMQTISQIITFNKPFQMAVAFSFMFFEYGMILSNEKAKRFIYETKTWQKQLLIIPTLLLINFLIVDYSMSKGIDFSYFLAIFAALWLIIQSIRLYGASRSFATSIETKWVNVYSPVRYVAAIITPWFLVILLTALSWGYRYFLVLGALDLLGPSVPFEAFEVYKILMKIVMPFVYISLIIIFSLILLETILTNKGNIANTKRAGVFDNLTFSLITFVMFIYLLFQISLFLVLNPRTVYAVKMFMGNNTGTGLFVFLEFAISMVFLFRIIAKLGEQYPHGVLFFNQEGSLMFFLGLVFCQTASRVSLYFNENLQETIISVIISYNHLVIPMLIILVLGVTIVLYYFKPRSVSIFMRSARDSIEEGDKSADTVLKFLRREFIRRGKSFLLSEIEQPLKEASGLPKELYLEILFNLKKRNVDLQIKKVENNGVNDYEIDFIALTENFGKESREKAQSYLRKKFSERILDDSTKKQKKTSVSQITFQHVELTKEEKKALEKKMKEEEKLLKTKSSDLENAKKAEEEAKKKAEEEAKKKAEEEQKKRKKAEEEAKKKAEEEQKKQKKAEEEQKKQKKAEEEAKKKTEFDNKNRQASTNENKKNILQNPLEVNNLGDTQKKDESKKKT